LSKNQDFGQTSEISVESFPPTSTILAKNQKFLPKRTEKVWSNQILPKIQTV